jgi:hemolysin activation/secretion protein
LDQFADRDKEALFFENELYRFGGANTLRGFDENIFYASIYSIQNAEIRYLFERNSAFYLFWNGAYYYKIVTQQITEDFPWGFGVGMDFQTKAGIFSLSYALGKQFDNPIGIRTAKIHFGYISRF